MNPTPERGEFNFMPFNWKPGLFVFIGFAICLFSCSKWDLERIEFTQVITVGAIEIGESSAFLIGDIEGLREGDVMETGFVYSSSARDESTLQLDEAGVFSKISARTDTSADRAFAVRVTGLETGTLYSFRAFIMLEQEPLPIYGQIDSFTTPDIKFELLSILRESSDCPTKAIISLDIGQGSSQDVNAGVVWTDSENNFIPTLDDANVLAGSLSGSNDQVQVELDLECDKVYFLRGYMISQGGIPIFTSAEVFTTIPGGKWFQRNDGPNIHIGYCFSIDNKGYVGGGDGCGLTHEVIEYNARTDSWNSKLIEGIERLGGLGFNIGNIGYVGTGILVGERCPANICAPCAVPCFCECIKDDLWRLKDGIWDRTVFNLPKLQGGVSFSIGNKAYFGTGVTADGCGTDITRPVTNNFWEFDPSSGITPVDPLPVPSKDTKGFTIGNKGYVSSLSGIGARLYEFDPYRPAGDQWRQIQDPPKNEPGKVMVLRSRAYWIWGTVYDYEIWEFDPAESYSWRQVATLTVEGVPAFPLETFSINNVGFVLLDRPEDNFWMYIPPL